METLSHCPACSASGPFNPFLNARDHLVSGDVFAVQRCKNCNFLFTNPRPTVDEMPLFYQSDAYISHTDGRASFFEIIYQLVKRRMLKRKVSLLNKHTEDTGKTILDFGCGTGSFLEAAARLGYDCYGVDQSKEARILASDKGLETFSNLDEIYTKDGLKFDAITLWHVMEHLHDFPNVFDTFLGLLKPGGVLIVAVPVSNSWDALHYGSWWAALDVPRHLFHFSREGLINSAKYKGFTFLGYKPLVFDAFYISLLSEQHMGRKALAPVFGFVKGLWSNTQAFFGNKPWSSEIYVFRR